MRIPAYSARPQPARLPLLLARVTCSVPAQIPDYPMDAGRPEHDEGDEFIEYDLYGWFQFESHASVCNALIVSGSRRTTWSRQKVGRRRF